MKLFENIFVLTIWIRLLRHPSLEETGVFKLFWNEATQMRTSEVEELVSQGYIKGEGW